MNFQSGHVLLDGVDIGTTVRKELRKEYQLVLQIPSSITGLSSPNIAMYQDISDEEGQAAAAFVDPEFLYSGPSFGL